MRILPGLTLVMLAALPFGVLDGAPVPKAKLGPKDGPLGMKFVPLPKGTFYMGWNGKIDSSEQTEIDEDFEIAIHTVTQGQWEAVMRSNPSYFSRDGDGYAQVKNVSDEDLHQFPVERVSWDECQIFLKKLNEQEKGKNWWYRLPCEKEWEYACRGGATSKEECSYHYYFEKPTNDLSSYQANFNGKQPAGNGQKGPYRQRTTKVGLFSPNRLGLYDMHGNVTQWCTDLENVSQIPKIETWAHTARGSNWSEDSRQCWARYRHWYAPTYYESTLGLRLVRVATPVGK